MLEDKPPYRGLKKKVKSALNASILIRSSFGKSDIV